MLKIISQESAIRQPRNSTINAETLQQAAQIIEQVRSGGETTLRELVAKWDHRASNQPLVFTRAECEKELARLPSNQRELLKRVAQRIQKFAEAQLETIRPMKMAISGGSAGSDWFPLITAGCYVPGGRYPLISSLLMTAITARIAGVSNVWVACPAPSSLMLAAAAIAQVDGLLGAGGAHAIAALTYGIGGPPPSDVVVGPGNRWVTAAKQLVAAEVRIDMLAGPSELVIVADESAEPETVAADLLAQAEHDIDARPMLVARSKDFVAKVNEEILLLLESLPTAAVAKEALYAGFSVIAQTDEEIVDVCQAIAPEHLELHVANPQLLIPRLTRCGCLFIGDGSAEVLGDYGAGPNHVLPTGGTARFTSGLSVETFLRRQTWLRIDDHVMAQSLVDDTIQMALLEGLPGHAASAQRRKMTDAE